MCGDGSVITEPIQEGLAVHTVVLVQHHEKIIRLDFAMTCGLTGRSTIRKAYTKPWTMTLRQQFAADTELIDEICAEGEKFAKQLK